MNEMFPEITIEGQQVVATDHVEKGTGTALFLAFFVAIIGSLFAILVSYGIIIIALLLAPIFAFYLRKKALALIHGSGVLVNETQFPEIYQCVLNFQQRLQLQKEVSVYIVEANVVNALAVRYGKKNVILLTDDLIQGCLASGNPQVLSFVIAHELGHIALNHNGLLRSWMAKYLKKLGRMDEYSADAVAMALVEDASVAYNGLLLLTIGYAMLPYVNPESIIAQAQEVATNKYSKKAEKTLTHPLLLNRLHRLLQE